MLKAPMVSLPMVSLLEAIVLCTAFNCYIQFQLPPLPDGTDGNRGSKAGLLGWTLDPHSFMVVAYLAVGPGLVGHTGMNGVLRHISPLVVSISLTLEPLFGSLLAGRAMPE
jgi:drug/metabolite transporter (DMT)-like permease